MHGKMATIRILFRLNDTKDIRNTPNWKSVNGWSGGFGTLRADVRKTIGNFTGPVRTLPKTLHTIRRRLEAMKSRNIIHDFETFVIMWEKNGRK